MADKLTHTDTAEAVLKLLPKAIRDTVDRDEKPNLTNLRVGGHIIAACRGGGQCRTSCRGGCPATSPTGRGGRPVLQLRGQRRLLTEVGMKRFTLGAVLVAIGVGLLAAPGPAVASAKSSCEPVYFRTHSGRIVITTATLDRIHTTRVSCALGRRVARETAKHAHQLSERRWRYHWHKFECNGYIYTRYTTGVGVGSVGAATATQSASGSASARPSTTSGHCQATGRAYRWAEQKAGGSKK